MCNEGKLIGKLTGKFLKTYKFKWLSLLKPELNEFVLSANLIGAYLVQPLKRSLIYMRKKSTPRMEPCGTPRVI